MGRKDGKRIKKLSGMGQLIMDINPQRIGSEVYINQKIDVTELMKYLKEKKKIDKDITFFHAIVTAFAKTVYSKEKLNYFINNRHLYKRNEVIISFVAKVEFSDSAEEIMVLVPIEEKDNIDKISIKVKNKVNDIRGKKENADKKGANSAIDVLGKIPNIIRVPLVGLLKIMDDKGMLPSSLKEDNLYYSTVLVSNLGSIKCGAIYHHLSNFGTNSVLATIGEVKDEIVIINGKEEKRKLCEFGITLDERIADGFYFAQAVKILEEICSNPRLLEEEVSKKVEIKIR